MGSEDEPLCPFFGLRLGVGPDDIRIIPTEVIITRLQRDRSAVDETPGFGNAGRWQSQAGRDEQQGKRWLVFHGIHSFLLFFRYRLPVRGRQASRKAALDSGIQRLTGWPDSKVDDCD